MIKVEIWNNTTRLSGNYKALNKLYKYLSFRHPGAYFIKKKIKYSWDGIVHPLNEKGIMKTGLLERAVDFLSDYETEYEILDHREVPEVGEIPYKVGELELTGKYSYQRKAVEAVVSNILLGQLHPRGIVVAGVNAGKTGMMMAIHKTYKDAKTIILLNSKVLYNQFKGDLAKVFPDTYGYMQGKSIKWGDIMVVMVQTLRNRLEEYSDKLLEYNVLLTDECDLAANETFEKVYKALSHISVRTGFTGTAFLRNLKKDMLVNTRMREIFGEAIFEIGMKDLEDLGVSTKTIIKSISVPLIPASVENFKDEMDYVITHNKKRNKVILKRLMYNLRGGRRPILVFTKYIEQTEILYTYLAKRLPREYILEYTHHKRSYPEVIEAFREGDIDVLISSLYLKRGMNFPLTKVVINASGGSWYANSMQILGRGTRLSENKKVFYFEDLFDQGVYLTKHSRQRIKYYKKLGYKIRYIG